MFILKLHTMYIATGIIIGAALYSQTVFYTMYLAGNLWAIRIPNIYCIAIIYTSIL